MAVLASLPSGAVIDGHRGKIDYYLWLGLPCVRRWPRWKLPERSPAVKAQTLAFTYVNNLQKELPAHVVETWREMASQSNLTWKDWLLRAYLGGTLTAPGMPPV